MVPLEVNMLTITAGTNSNNMWSIQEDLLGFFTLP